MNVIHTFALIDLCAHFSEEKEEEEEAELHNPFLKSIILRFCCLFVESPFFLRAHKKMLIKQDDVKSLRSIKSLANCNNLSITLNWPYGQIASWMTDWLVGTNDLDKISHSPFLLLLVRLVKSVAEWKSRKCWVISIQELLSGRTTC